MPVKAREAVGAATIPGHISSASRAAVETLFGFVAIVVVVGVLSTMASRFMTRKRGAIWIWDHSNVIGWLLIGAGLALIASGFLIDRGGTAMNAKLGLGSLLLIAGLWMIW